MTQARTTLAWVVRIDCRTLRIKILPVSFDLVEFQPALDPTCKSALDSAHIVEVCLAGLAMNKEGKSAGHYLSARPSEHAIDDYCGDLQEHLDATKAEEEERKKAEGRQREA